MVTFFLMGLVGTALILGVMPLVLFGLMLETCGTRSDGGRPLTARASSGVFRTDSARLSAVVTDVAA